MKSERPPIIAVMGHVDHGKSTLLDYIRKSNITEGEEGGITQHISAYEVEHGGKKITFLDTPGHEAFSAIRKRGALVADIAVLVVAADDGVKPQTVEAYECIKSAGIPFIVGINKIDKNGADIESTKGSLAEKGIFVEGFGGDIPFTPISALNGDGVSDLLDTILLVAEVEELNGNPEDPAEGFVVESHLDPKKGISATLIITNGTLEIGSFIVSGESYSPVRYIEDFTGDQIESASLSKPIVITGWSTIPRGGEPFFAVSSKQEAEENVIQNKEEKVVETIEDSDNFIVPIVIKSDAYGTLDAVVQEIENMSFERVAPKIIHLGTGPITEQDIQTAMTKENTVVIGFNVKVEQRAKHLSDREGVEPQTFTIIYKLTEWLEKELEGQSPKFDTEEIKGQAKILKAFSKSKSKQVLGGRLEEGNLSKGSNVKIERRGNIIGEGELKELQKDKKKVGNVDDGEFGMMLESKIEILPGDIIRSIDIVKK